MARAGRRCSGCAARWSPSSGGPSAVALGCLLVGGRCARRARSCWPAADERVTRYRVRLAHRHRPRRARRGRGGPHRPGRCAAPWTTSSLRWVVGLSPAVPEFHLAARGRSCCCWPRPAARGRARATADPSRRRGPRDRGAVGRRRVRLARRSRSRWTASTSRRPAGDVAAGRRRLGLGQEHAAADRQRARAPRQRRPLPGRGRRGRPPDPRPAARGTWPTPSASSTRTPRPSSWSTTSSTTSPSPSRTSASTRPTMRRRVEEVLDALGIAHLRHRSPATLSGGERQRCAVAGAMAAGPVGARARRADVDARPAGRRRRARRRRPPQRRPRHHRRAGRAPPRAGRPAWPTGPCCWPAAGSPRAGPPARGAGRLRRRAAGHPPRPPARLGPAAADRPRGPPARPATAPPAGLEPPAATGSGATPTPGPVAGRRPGSRGRARRRRRGAAGSTSSCGPARSSPCWAATGRARPRCCGPWPAWPSPLAGADRPAGRGRLRAPGPGQPALRPHRPGRGGGDPPAARPGRPAPRSTAGSTASASRDLADRHPRSLSTGAAPAGRRSPPWPWAGRPSLLLDEPTRGIDAALAGRPRGGRRRARRRRAARS